MLKWIFTRQSAFFNRGLVVENNYTNNLCDTSPLKMYSLLPVLPPESSVHLLLYKPQTEAYCVTFGSVLSIIKQRWQGDCRAEGYIRVDSASGFMEAVILSQA